MAAVDAGVGDQDVDRPLPDRLVEAGDRGVVADVEPVDRHAAERLQHVGPVRVAHARDDLRPVGGVLPGQLQADAAVRSGDHDGGHGNPLRLTAAFNAPPA